MMGATGKVLLAKAFASLPESTYVDACERLRFLDNRSWRFL